MTSSKLNDFVIKLANVNGTFGVGALVEDVNVRAQFDSLVFKNAGVTLAGGVDTDRVQFDSEGLQFVEGCGGRSRFLFSIAFAPVLLGAFGVGLLGLGQGWERFVACVREARDLLLGFGPGFVDARRVAFPDDVELWFFLSHSLLEYRL